MHKQLQIKLQIAETNEQEPEGAGSVTSCRHEEGMG